MTLLVAQGVLHPADGIANLALRLIDLAFRLEFLVAGQLAGLFFEFAFRLLGGSFDTILVHRCSVLALLDGWATADGARGFLRRIGRVPALVRLALITLFCATAAGLCGCYRRAKRLFVGDHLDRSRPMPEVQGLQAHAD